MTKTAIQTVKLAKLTLSDINVRVPRGDLIEQLAADVASRGIIQNLIVTPVKKPCGTFAVIAGSRRLRALELLAAEGQIDAATYDVPVLVIEADEAALSETSLAENFQHLAMSPADECRAFQHFIGETGDLDAVAKRFGLTRKFVEGRLRLAGLAEPIFEALAAGDITLDMAKAYASTPSHERQLRVWTNYGRSPHYGADSIRRIIGNDAMMATEAVALLVGADRYVAAGGTIETDLFSENGDRWISREVAETIAAQIMEEEAAKLGSELGLAWVRPVASHNTWEVARELHKVTLPAVPMSGEEQARLKEIQDRLEAIEIEMEDENLDEAAYNALETEAEALQDERTSLYNRPKILPDELKPKVGRILALKQNGEMELQADYYSETPLRVTPIVEPPVRGGDEASEASDENPDADGGVEGGEAEGRITGWQIEEGSTTTRGGGASEPVKPIAAAPDGKAMSQVLFDQLAIQRRDVLGAALLADPALALDYMLFAMVDERGSYSSGSTGTTIKAKRPDDPVSADNLPPSRARTYIIEFAEALEDAWCDGKTKVERFEGFRALSDESKAQWMAWVVATSLTAKDTYGVSEPNTLQNRLATILQVDVASWWRPTSLNFFDRISKGAALALLDEVGGPALSGRHASQKKSEISASCEKLFAGEAIIEADVREVVTTWVPEAMRFTDAPAEASEAEDDLEDGKDLSLTDEDAGEDDLGVEGDDDLQLSDHDDADPQDEDVGLPIEDKDDLVSDREAEDDFSVNDGLEAIAAE